MEYKELNKEFCGRHLWASGYFVASSGNVTDEIIQEYIKNQDIEERKKSDNFEVGQFQAASAASPNPPALASGGSAISICPLPVLKFVMFHFTEIEVPIKRDKISMYRNYKCYIEEQLVRIILEN